MKTIIAVIFAVLVSGCAGLGTGNPYLQNTGTTIATVGGAALGYKKYGPWGAVVGGYLGNQLSKAAQYDPNQPQEEVVYVNAGNGLYQDPYGSDPICNRIPPGGMNPLDPGMCMDPRGGGTISRAFLVNNPYYACCGKLGGALPPQTQQTVVSSQALYERPEKRKQQEVQKVKSVKLSGPTIEDYRSPRWSQAIPEDCRTGNSGHDSVCLSKLVSKLQAKQHDCESDAKKCNPNLNFGKMARYSEALAQALREDQDN